MNNQKVTEPSQKPESELVLRAWRPLRATLIYTGILAILLMISWFGVFDFTGGAIISTPAVILLPFTLGWLPFVIWFTISSLRQSIKYLPKVTSTDGKKKITKILVANLFITAGILYLLLWSSWGKGYAGLLIWISDFYGRRLGFTH